MNHFDEDEKPHRKAAIHKIMAAMGTMTAQRLKTLKKPAAGAAPAPGMDAGMTSDTEIGDDHDDAGGGFCASCGKPK